MSDEKPMGQVIQIDEGRIRDHLGEMVRGTRPRGASFRPAITSTWGEAFREPHPPASARASSQFPSAC